ncbi:TerD family protein [Candidatus Contendibacter odensensis]|uniref:Tellurium resistance protein n=1 Tax=Candidatus Contendobacter odensis Run_B_J11 TaxID=1400861 RepID=A0A7U7J217_9GAMM|nr:TerD family protein [Candidatus Contendobacter odensis]CDH44488.1 tellurium resistance protein [Candidatus Contendobacter odensis Run_B_J11]
MDLQPGQNIAITRHSPPPTAVEITLAWEPVTTPLAIDSSAFALSAQGKVRGDGDFIFYNQLALAGGGLQRASDGRSFTITFAQLPASIERIVIALTIDQGQRRGQSFGQLSQVRAEIREAGSKATLATFPLATKMMPETALIVGELYRRNNEWKFRAVGQGFVGGLGPLARQYGVDVADDPDVAEAAPPPHPTAPAPTSTPLPSSPKPIRLEKITLDKKTPSISLEKKAQGFGEIVVNLNWNQGSGGKGFFGRLTSRKIDLDLGCLFKLSDGRPGAVQALGGNFGSLQQLPYIQLMGDDRSGASAAGEFLHINGQQWGQLDRVLVFAMIYEGAPNWAETDAVVTITIPGQPTLELRVDSHRNDQRMCALAMLENQNGNIKVTKLVEYFADHRVLDQAYGFGLRWVAGSKD